MQPRPQHHRLPRHHGYPSHRDQRGGEIPQRRRRIILDEEAGTVKGNTPRGAQEGPKVQTRVSFKGAPDDKGELEDIVHGQREEDDDDDLEYLRLVLRAGPKVRFHLCRLEGDYRECRR